MRHLSYEKNALCCAPPAQGVLLAVGRKTGSTEFSAEFVHQPCDTNCPLCMATYVIWATDTGLSEILEVLTTPERLSFAEAKHVAERSAPGSDLRRMAEHRFAVFLKRTEEKSQRWLMHMRKNPVLA